MDAKNHLITNFILGAIIIGAHGIRVAFNWDILNGLNKTDHSPIKPSTLDNYFDWIGHGFWCMAVIWWGDLKQYSKLKKWVNAMSILSLVALISMICFNVIYQNFIE